MTPQFTTVTLQRLVNLAWSTNYLLTNAARIARHGWYIVDCCVIFSTRLVNLLLRACYIGMECLLHVMICHNSVCQYMSPRMPRWIVHTFTGSHYGQTRAYRLLVKYHTYAMFHVFMLWSVTTQYMSNIQLLPVIYIYFIHVDTCFIFTFRTHLYIVILTLFCACICGYFYNRSHEIKL